MIIVGCRSCEAKIIWTVTERGNRMPVDADPVSWGNIRLTQDDPPRAIYLRREECEAARVAGERLYVSHFSDCPFAGQHRKKKPATA